MPIKRIPYFKPGKELKDLINDESEVPGQPDRRWVEPAAASEEALLDTGAES